MGEIHTNNNFEFASGWDYWNPFGVSATPLPNRWSRKMWVKCKGEGLPGLGKEGGGEYTDSPSSLYSSHLHHNSIGRKIYFFSINNFSWKVNKFELFLENIQLLEMKGETRGIKKSSINSRHRQLRKNLLSVTRSVKTSAPSTQAHITFWQLSPPLIFCLIMHLLYRYLLT